MDGPVDQGVAVLDRDNLREVEFLGHLAKLHHAEWSLIRHTNVSDLALFLQLLKFLGSTRKRASGSAFQLTSASSA